MTARPPRIGFLVIVHPDYDIENALRFGKDAVDRLVDRGVDVVMGTSPIADPIQAKDAAIAMSKEGIDGVILFLGTWTEGPICMPIVKQLEHLPLALWAFGIWDSRTMETTGSLVFFGVMNGTLRRMGIRASTIIGLSDDDEAFSKAVSFAKCASIKSQLKEMRIGRIGAGFAIGMYSGSFDHVLLRSRIGPEVICIDSIDLINGTLDIPPSDCQQVLDRIGQIAHVCADVDENMLIKASKLYLSAKALISKHHLDVVNMKCQYELSQGYGCVACLPISLLADDGIVSACEGDIPTTLSMAILSRLSGQQVFYGDVDLLDKSKKRIIISTCGFLPYGIPNKDEPIRIQEIAHSGFSGPINSCRLPAGRITYARLHEKCGSYAVVAGTGTAVEVRTLRQERFPTIEIEIDGNVDKFVETLTSQHYPVIYGDYMAELEDLCMMLGIEFQRI